MTTSEKLKVHALLSKLIIAVGVLLLGYMVAVEGEPGGIPILLVVFGTGWYLVTRGRIRSRHR